LLPKPPEFACLVDVDASEGRLRCDVRPFLVDGRPIGGNPFSRNETGSDPETVGPTNALFLLNVVAEVIDPVMGSSQLGRIERQIRTIEATNIRVMNLLLVLYPFIGRLQAGDGARETVEKIVRWNYRLRIIFLHDCIHLSTRED
jgi:hypothetical protein